MIFERTFHPFQERVHYKAFGYWVVLCIRRSIALKGDILPTTSSTVYT